MSPIPTVPAKPSSLVCNSLRATLLRSMGNVKPLRLCTGSAGNRNGRAAARDGMRVSKANQLVETISNGRTRRPAQKREEVKRRRRKRSKREKDEESVGQPKEKKKVGQEKRNSRQTSWVFTWSGLGVGNSNRSVQTIITSQRHQQEQSPALAQELLLESSA